MKNSSDEVAEMDGGLKVAVAGAMMSSNKRKIDSLYRGDVLEDEIKKVKEVFQKAMNGDEQDTLLYIPIEMLDASANVRSNPRENPVAFSALKRSIKERGIVEPLRVRPAKVEGVIKGLVLSGSRRFTAATELGFSRVPCLVFSSQDALRSENEIGIMTNAIRTKMNIIDEATIINEMISVDFKTTAEAALAVGKSESYVKSLRRLMKNSPTVLEAVRSNESKLGKRWILSSLCVRGLAEEDALSLIREKLDGVDKPAEQQSKPSSRFKKLTLFIETKRALASENPMAFARGLLEELGLGKEVAWPN